MNHASIGNFHHIFIDNNAQKTLVLLHGTGADEKDLLPLVSHLKDRYNFLGLRGNVNDDGLTRFFRRYDDGTFDQKNIRLETQKLAEFINAWSEKNKFQIDQLAFLGYSNGANMILATVFYFPDVVSQAVLLHPMLPFEPPKISLAKKSFLVSFGEHDQMIPADKSKQVVKTLDSLGATVDVVKHDGGHEIRREEVERLSSFLQ